MYTEEYLEMLDELETIYLRKLVSTGRIYWVTLIGWVINEEIYCGMVLEK